MILDVICEDCGVSEDEEMLVIDDEGSVLCTDCLFERTCNDDLDMDIQF